MVTQSPTFPSPKRYSDEELAEFKENILAKIKTNDTTLTEKRSGKLDEDTLDVINKLEKENIKLYHALDKVKKKTYGICEQTKQLIPRERLKAVPEATCVAIKSTEKKFSIPR